MKEKFASLALADSMIGASENKGYSPTGIYRVFHLNMSVLISAE
jgi:hypothetical protein